MTYKSLSILVIIFLCTSVFLAQSSEEEKRRMNFAKSLQKKKDKENKALAKKEKPAQLIDKIEVKTPPQTDDSEVIRVETQLVRTDILVYDEKGKAVLGLKPEDFTVTENKIEQEIGTFSLGDSEDVPRTIVLIIDYSGSQKPYIKTSVSAAKLLVDKLNPQDKMAIVTDDVELLVDFTRDKSLLKSSLDKLQRKAEKGDVGESLQFSALYSVIKEMFDSEDIRPIIIFQTDGDQLLSIRRDNQPIDPRIPNPTSFTDIQMLDTIERSRVTVYSVISGDSLLGLTEAEQVKKITPYLQIRRKKLIKERPEEILVFASYIFRQQTTMAIVAKLTGGFSENLETPEQADKIYENILQGISNRYLIGYYPSTQERNGKRRIVTIKVKNHPEYVILGRRFYYPLENKVK